MYVGTIINLSSIGYPNRSFTDAERANVHAEVGLMAATCRDKDKELSQEVSHILQAGQAWDELDRAPA